ncbi:MAG: ferritin family protein [Acidobacteriota bacterium]|jgi:rubrerythrin|nr:ferritin family protein [Acidobacteriota bacterium]
MGKNEQIDIIKGAILLEHRGRALYESVAASQAKAPVRELFRLLAGEEEQHIEILSRQYASLNKDGSFALPDLETADQEAVDRTLTDKVLQEITAAGYEAAVISAALDFEKKAVEYYSSRARATQDADERRLYQWLADWETTHMTLFAEMDDHLREEVWYDNRFWPMD